jgi:glycerate kinase
MKITIAMDSFKGSLTSMEAGTAIQTGVLRACPDAQVQVRPLADGGEGTCAALTVGMGGIFRDVAVTGPSGTPVTARYGIVRDTLAVMEMAAAAGLPLVPPAQRNPMHTTTFGLGEMILDAIGQGCRDFIIGIGGSATNDGGAGMLQALGFDLLDTDGLPVPHGGAGAARLARVEWKKICPELKDCRFRIACDVTNPLCGPDGCSAVYGPQKGADPMMVDALDAAMMHYAQTVRRFLPHADPDFPGAGAAGGLGFAFRTFLNGTLCSGADLVMRETELEECIRWADLVITGEGRLDGQTAHGKGPAAVGALAKKHGKAIVALAGCIGHGAEACQSLMDAYFPIVPGPCALEDALQPDTARTNLARTAEQVLRLWMSGKQA